MSLDGTIAYDPALDQVFGPHKNMLVIFARGLFARWKQPIMYGYDKKLDRNDIQQIIQEVHKTGLQVVSITCDNAPSNRGIWTSLGVNYKNPSFTNSVTANPVFCFSDPPHLIKLLRNNMLDHGFRLKDGTLIVKQDLINLLRADNNEHRICHKLNHRHLNVTGAERMNVRLAFETISNTVACALKKNFFAGKAKQADFFKLANDSFDVLNSRLKNDSNPMKCSFGVHLKDQIKILDQFYDEIENMRVIGSRALYPFQRGILMCINSLKGLFQHLHTSDLRIQYLNVNRINQDVAENAFSIIRSIGKFKQTPNPVDANYRLRYLCLMWHLLIARSTSPVMNECNGDEDEVIFATKISPLMIEVPTQSPEIPMDMDEQLSEISLDELQLSSSTWESFNNDLSIRESFEFGGIENLAAYIAKKLQSQFSNLELPAKQEKRQPQSWVQTLSKGGLHIPLYDFINVIRNWNLYFTTFHDSYDKWKLNRCSGVIETLSMRISKDWAMIDLIIIKRYVKIRTFIRLKFYNDKIEEAKHKKRNLRKRKQFGRAQEVNLSESEDEISE